MDPAVGLVQAYLRLNGFFTLTEYPVIARTRGGTTTLTDVDILAVRFPDAARWVPGFKRPAESLPYDQQLISKSGWLQMFIGEVKEGKAKLNRMSYSLPVIETVIRRFGCCSIDPSATARRVFQAGAAETHVGNGMPCHIQMVVFGGTSGESSNRNYKLIPLRRAVEFLGNYLNQYRDVFLQTQIKEQGLDLMALLVKLGIKL